MTFTRFALAVGVLTGCHLQAGFDAKPRINGPLQTLMTQSTVSRSDGVTNLPPTGGGTYGVEAGFGNKTFTINGVLAVHDVTSTSFTPGAGYLATTLGLNVRWSMLRWHGLSPVLDAGPARMMLLDRTSGERAWGNGVRAGAGLQYQLGPIALCADFYHEVIVFGGGAAEGTSKLDGVMLGVALQP
jgi:hypothetical protein